MMDKKRPDFMLVRANLHVLENANQKNCDDMWEFSGIEMPEVLTKKYLPFVRCIAMEIGESLLSSMVQFLDKDLYFINFQKGNITLFIDLVQSYCDVCQWSYIDHKKALKAMQALASLLNRIDLIYTKKDECNLVYVNVTLPQSACILLSEMICASGLQDEFFDVEEQFVSQKMSSVSLHRMLRVLEEYIRAQNDYWDKFIFDLEEFATVEKPCVEMTLAEFVQHENNCQCK